jgi:hypothetical protein
MGKHEEQKDKIAKLKKEVKHLRAKVSSLEKQLANERATKLQRIVCNPAKANPGCNCRLHRAYRNYYMTHNPADSYEAWLRDDKRPSIVSVSESESQTSKAEETKSESRKKNKGRSVQWGKP